jgi:hypothetical protein
MPCAPILASRHAKTPSWTKLPQLAVSAAIIAPRT